MSSIIGKVVVMYMMDQIKGILAQKLQVGFTPGYSPVHSAVLITESVAEARDQHAYPVITYMDASKAFDMVCHNGMLNLLHQQGIQGPLWDLDNSLYSGTKSTVK